MIDRSLSYAPLARHNFGKNEVIQASLNPNQPHEVVLSVENSSIIAKICEQGKSPQQTTRVEEIGARCVGEEKDDAKEGDMEDVTLQSGHVDDGSDDGKQSSREVRSDQEETKDGSINDDEDRDEGIKDRDKDIKDEDEDINDKTDSDVGGMSSLTSNPQTIKDKTQQPTDAPTLRRRKNEGTAKSEETETTTPGVSKDPEYSLAVGQEYRTDFAEKESLQKVARFSCDGRFVITGGVDGCVRVWEVSVYVRVCVLYSVHCRGVFTPGVSSLQRCPHYRGVLTTEVSSLQGCPHYRGILTTEVSPLQGCPH